MVKKNRPLLGMPGSRWEGFTNDQILGVIRVVLGGPPEVGELYRVTMAQGLNGRPGNAIMEFCGFTTDRIGRLREPALLFAIRNPVLPLESPYGTREHPLVLYPLDILFIGPAELSDLDVPMAYHQQGDPATLIAAPGTPRVQ